MTYHRRLGPQSLDLGTLSGFPMMQTTSKDDNDDNSSRQEECELSILTRVYHWKIHFTFDSEEQSILGEIYALTLQGIPKTGTIQISMMTIIQSLFMLQYLNKYISQGKA